jgi:thymidylate kinase
MNLKWTEKQRITAASKLLCQIQSDIYDGHYSDPGNPNLTTVMHVLNSESDLLNTSPELLAILQRGEDQVTRDCLPHGIFVVIEGGDMVGKSVQSEMLTLRLSAQPSSLHPLPEDLALGRHVLNISFPDYESRTGRLIDDYLHSRSFEDSRETDHFFDALGKSMGLTSTSGDSALIFQCLQIVDKYVVVPRIITELESGASVVVSRWWPSGVVYGADDGISQKWIMSALHAMPMPDVMVLLDGEPEKMATRLQKRTGKADKFDLDMKKQKRITASYRDLWQQHENDSSWQVVNADGDIDEVAERVFQAVCKGLGL